MYMQSSMLDLSPIKPRSKKHWLVARIIIIGNSDINTVEDMTKIIIRINNVPDENIETIPFRELLA